jgi:hypothetical protein
MVNEPSIDALSNTLTVSAFVEMDMPTTMPKIIMDDLMIMNDLETNSGVTSWSSLGDDSCGLQPEHIHSNCSFLASSAAVSRRPGISPMNNQFGGHEGMIATVPSVLQGLDVCGTRWNPSCEGPLSG